MKTPTSNLASNGGSQHPSKRKQGGHGPNLADEIEWLLPTPKASDGTKGSPRQRHGNGDLTLPSAAAQLHRHSTARSASPEQTTVPLFEAPAPPHYAGSWGRYAEAIARWERLTRQAPAPTDDAGRLSPRFVEWMQGLDDGWVTATPGLGRPAQLAALGNGVIPQQAEQALRLLLPVAPDCRCPVSVNLDRLIED